MSIVISPDFCVRPALCETLDVETAISDIILLNKIIQQDIDFLSISLCEDIMSHIEKKGFYPTDKIFKKQIKESGLDDFFSINDLVTALLNILDRTNDICEDNNIAGVINNDEDIKFTPELNTANGSAIDYCYRDTIKNLAAIKNINKKSHSIINSNFPNTINIEIKNPTIFINNIEIKKQLINEDIEVNSCIRQKILKLDISELYSHVKNKDNLHLVLFFRTLQAINEIGGDIQSIDLDSFVIGEHFFNSLYDCQCNPDAKFSDVFLETVSKLLAGNPKNEESPFRVGKEKTAKQKTKGDLLAYRTHITKSKEGLRLMYWKCKSGGIELANVGNKQDLEIK